jgi:hypothetical protein
MKFKGTPVSTHKFDKDGRLVPVKKRMSVSKRIAQSKSKKVRVATKAQRP